MKRYLILLAIATLFFATPSAAVVTYNCDTLTGGAARALDYASVSDLSDGDRAIVVREVGGVFYTHYFKYDASGTTAETVATHPYMVRPDDYATAGVWVETVGVWVYGLTDTTLNNLTVSGTLAVGNCHATGTLRGGIDYRSTDSHAGVTLSGSSVFGCYISGDSNIAAAATSGITFYMESMADLGENFTILHPGETGITGTTIWVVPYSGDTYQCNQEIDAGVSAFQITGTTLAQSLSVIATGVSEASIVTRGTPDVVWR